MSSKYCYEEALVDEILLEADYLQQRLKLIKIDPTNPMYNSVARITIIANKLKGLAKGEETDGNADGNVQG